MTTEKGATTISNKEWWKIFDLSDRKELIQERKNDLLSSVKLGIDQHMIPKVWGFLAEIQKLKSNFKEINYTDLATIHSDYSQVILNDIASQNITGFTGDIKCFQEMLFKVLRAYSVINSENAYSTGMDQIAQAILYNLIPQDDEFEILYDPAEIEEQCFWIFFYIMEIQQQKKFYATDRTVFLNTLNKFDK